LNLGKIKKLINSIERNPKVLFLIDGIGALVTAFCLGIVLVHFENIFGIPPSILYVLAVIAIFYAVYDFYSYRQPKAQAAKYLRGIAVLNIMYCLSSLSLASYHSEQITIWAWAYLINEIIIIVLLSMLEFKIANNYKSISPH